MMAVIHMLTFRDLTVKTGDKELLKDLSFDVFDGETVCLMGPNGAGKSSLCKALMHHPSYSITKGQILYNHKDITNLTTSEIAMLGIYYINQTPVEIEGITNAEMIRTALISKGEKVDIFAFNKQCNEVLKKLDLPKSFLHRNINEGMSGGERKKNELFGMWMLKPSFVILDEIDSGLDVDALKVVGENLRDYQRETGATLLLITHQQKLIDILKPSKIVILNQGEIVKIGDYSLAKEIEVSGFSSFTRTNEESKEGFHE